MIIVHAIDFHLAIVHRREQGHAERQFVFDQWHVEHSCNQEAIRSGLEPFILRSGFGAKFELGLLGDDVHRAAGRIATPERPLRTTEDIDPFDVKKVDQARAFACRENAVHMDSEARVDTRPDDFTSDTAKCDLREPATGEEARNVVLEIVEVREPRVDDVGV